jgi:hypothetical protein
VGRKRKNGECAYCGNDANLTEDHVIPKCLFTKPNPPNMIKIYACKDCNNLKSKNDDYLRDLLVNDMFSANSYVAQNNLVESFRSAQRNTSDFSRQIIPRANLIPFHSQGGIYLGEVFEMPIDTSRVSNIFSQIVCGLFFWQYKKRLPSTYEFNVERISADGFIFEINLLNQFIKEIQFKHTKFNDVLFLAHTTDSEDEFITKWWLIFYGAVIWTIETFPPELKSI